MAVHGHSAVYLLHKSSVNVQRFGISQRMTVNINGQGIGVPFFDVVSLQLTMGTPPPRQIIVNPNKDRKCIYAGIGERGHHFGNVLGFLPILVIDNPVTISVKNEPGRCSQPHLNSLHKQN